MPSSSTTTGALLREVARLYTRAQRVAADCCSTTGTQCHLLTELGRSGAMPLTELGQRLCLEKSWVSRAVDGLVEARLVTKEPNPSDARSWLVTLTAGGKARVADLNHTLDNHAGLLLGSLSERDRAGVEKSLRLLLDALREEVDIAGCCAPPSTAKEGKSCC
jgi:DNA-binding MarR family transcriptional regulator